MTTTQPPSIDLSAPLPPGTFGLPIVGETLEFFSDPQFAQRRHQKYGSVFKTRIFGAPTIYVKGAEAVKFVLTHENQYFIVNWPQSTQVLLGPLTLSMQTGDLHQSRRKILAQAFMPRSLSGYIAAMEEIIQQYAQRWTQQEVLVWYPELRRYTLDVACKLLVGLDDGSQTPLGHWFEIWTQGLFTIPIPLPWTKFGRAKRSRRELLKEVERIIRNRQQSPDSSSDALGLLMQAEDDNGDRLSVEELKDQILVLLFAGHETLTSAIASFCLRVAQHPQVLAKLRTEQEQFTDKALSLDLLKQMSYLEQVLKEVLRFTPPVGGGFRKVTQSCTLNGYLLPEGWNVLYQIGSTHEDRDIYIQPEQFDPERFNPERAEDRQKFGYVPFGGGIRECLGKEFARLEMKLFAIHLIRNYEWELLPDQDLELVMIPTPRPRDGLRVRFYRRKDRG